jgi:hypothetical protein
MTGFDWNFDGQFRCKILDLFQKQCSAIHQFSAERFSSIRTRQEMTVDVTA